MSYDLDGRVLRTFAPRDVYDADTVDDGTQQGQCRTLTGNDKIVGALIRRPDQAAGVRAYPDNVGVCIQSVAYDPDGRVTRQYGADSVGLGALDPTDISKRIADNRFVATTYTADGLEATKSYPSARAADQLGTGADDDGDGIPNGIDDGPTSPGNTTVKTSGGGYARFVTSSDYDAVGRLLRQTDAAGVQKGFTYTKDGLGTKEEVSAPGSAGTTHTTLYEYDDNGNRTKVVAPNGAGQANADAFTTITTYTSDNLVQKERAPGIAGTDFNITAYTYDLVGNQQSIKTPNSTKPGGHGRATINLYTRDNLLLSSSVPLTASLTPGGEKYPWRTTYYSYTPSGQKDVVRVGGCSAANASAVGCVPGSAAWVNPPDGRGVTRYSYAPNGLNLHQIGANDQSISTRYDQAGRPIQVIDNSSGFTVNTMYYLDGLTKRVSDRATQQSFAYNGAGQVSRRHDATPDDGGVAGPMGSETVTTTYGFTDGGTPASMTGKLGTTRFNYDTAGRLATITDGAGVVSSYTYLADGRLGSLTTKSGGGADRAKHTYTYDHNGNIKTHGFTGSAYQAATHTYDYNPANNVTKFASSPSRAAVPAQTYTYDNNGNRLSATSAAGGTTSWTYNANNQIEQQSVTGASARVYTYDAEGLLKTDGCTEYTYDDFSRTKTAQTSASASCGGQASTSTYTYDGLDRQRTLQVNATSNNKRDHTTRNVYDAMTTQLLGQVDAVAGESENSTGKGFPNTYYQLDPSGRPVGITQDPDGAGAPVTHRLIDDGYLNITGVIENTSTANVVCAVEYDPWGSGLTPTTGGNGLCQQPETAAVPQGPKQTANTSWYRGGAQDPFTGNYQLGARTYNPKDAAFTTPDFFRVADSPTDLSVTTDPLMNNTYNYVNGNPINAYDPTGHWGISLPSISDVVDTVTDTVSDVADAAVDVASDAVDAHRKVLEFTGEALIEVGKFAGEQAYEWSGAKDIVGAIKACASGVSKECMTKVFVAGTGMVPVGKLASKGIKLGANGFKAVKKAGKSTDEVGGAGVKTSRKAKQAEDGAAKRTDSAGQPTGASCPVRGGSGAHSFSGDTLVLMGDGTHKPLDAIKKGDMVVATDPVTGESTAKKVTRVWVHRDTLTDLVLADGERITTTEDHPFWSATDQTFQDAKDLGEGEKVRGPAGKPTSRVKGFDPATAHRALAYNLTVAGLHTYHVGVTEVLVHNTNCGSGSKGNDKDAAKTESSLVKYEEWPANNGFFGGFEKDTVLQPGTRIDRYGSNRGSFASPEGTPFKNRGLPGSRAGDPYSSFTVQKPITVRGGIAAPWMDSPGGGVQYLLPRSVQELLEGGFLG